MEKFISVFIFYLFFSLKAFMKKKLSKQTVKIIFKYVLSKFSFLICPQGHFSLGKIS